MQGTKVFRRTCSDSSRPSTSHTLCARCGTTSSAASPARGTRQNIFTQQDYCSRWRFQV
jgi:hypothetical protein